MSTLDDVIVNAKSAADCIGKKAGKLLDNAKLNIQIADIKSDISKCYEKFGMTAYQLYLCGAIKNPELDEKASEIKELLSQLESAQEIKNNEHKKTLICQICGEKIEAGSVYCSKCGSKVL